MSVSVSVYVAITSVRSCIHFLHIVIFRVVATAFAHVFHHGEVPERMRRRKKSARERREQRARALARAFQSVATVLDNVAAHRGGNLRKVGVLLRWDI